MSKRYLFITGCPRSGTSGMWSILKASSQVVIGNEWFAGRAGELQRAFYEAPRMFAPEFGVDCGYDINTHTDTRDYVPLAKQRHASARYVGDKITYLYRHLDQFAEEFPGAKVIYMIRDIFDVAASYARRAGNSGDLDWKSGGVENAIQDWNESLEALLHVPDGIEVLPVHFRRFYMMGETMPLLWLRIADRDVINAWSDSVAVIGKGFATQRKSLSTADVGRIGSAANLRLYETICAQHAQMGYGPLQLALEPF
jgi:hypothetical protein